MESSAVQPVRSEPIDQNLIDIPADTREHDPQEIDLSARNLNDIGQLQPIAVLAKEGGRFDVIFGKGRVLAARKAGRTQIDARIYEGLSPYQRLEMMYSENKRREKPNPIYEARLLQGMKESGQFKTQGALASQKGMSDAMLSDYLGFLKFPAEALQIFTMVKINYRALREVKTLEEQGQLQIAQELKAGKLQPDDVIKRCKQLGGGKGKNGKSPSPAPHPMNGGGGTGGPDTQGPPDPLAEKWRALENNPALAALTGRWGIYYGSRPPQPGLNGPMATVPGWNFWVSAATSTPPATISGFLQEVIKILIPGQGPLTKWEQDQAAYAKVVAERTAYIASHPKPAPPPPPKPQPARLVAMAPQPAPMSREKEEARREVLALKAKLTGRPQ